MELKKINLSKDKNSEHSVQIRSILGKSFDQNEIGLI